MTSIKPKWEQEATGWNANGDPAPSQPPDIAAANKELDEKEIARLSLLREIDAEVGSIFEELVGVDLRKVLAGGAAGWTIGKFLSEVERTQGRAAAQEVAETIAEELGTQVSEVMLPSGRFYSYRPNWRQFLRKVFKRLGGKVVGALAGAGSVLALLTAATVISKLVSYYSLYGDMDTVRRAMRVEFLLLDPETDPTRKTLWFNPDKAARERLLGDPPLCEIWVKVVFRWIDSDTGETRTKEQAEAKVSNFNSQTGAFEHETVIDIGDKACFAEIEMTWIMHCPTTPPSQHVLVTTYQPIRTSAPCQNHRGELPD